MAEVSVVIPVHNAEPYLRHCLESVKRQSYADFEVIIYNDASTDASVRICTAFALTDTRFKVVDNNDSKPLGCAAARNRALQHASGNYITFLDADDVWHPDFLSTLISLLQQYPQADIAAAPHISFVGMATPPTPSDNALSHSLRLISGKRAAAVMLHQTGTARGLHVSVWGKLYRASLKERLHFIPGFIYEDLALLPPLVATLRGVITTTQPLYLYRIHTGSALGSFTPQRLQVLTVVFALHRTFKADRVLRQAAADRLFAAAFNIRLLCLQADSDMLHHSLHRLLRLLRRNSLFHPAARLRNRLGAALLYLPGLAMLCRLLRHRPKLLLRLTSRR